MEQPKVCDHSVNPETDRCVMCGKNRFNRELEQPKSDVTPAAPGAIIRRPRCKGTCGDATCAVREVAWQLAWSAGNQARNDARDYVDKQLATMVKYGSDPKLSSEEYNGLVEEIVEITLREYLKRSLQATEKLLR